MSTVTYNYYTGKLVSGEIKPPPPKWWVKNVLIPFKQWNDDYLKMKEKDKERDKQ